jgi:uncharacterized protein (DUF58 family)
MSNEYALGALVRSGRSASSGEGEAGSPWRPTHALVRAGLVSATFAAVAVGFGRPDLMVLATPFLVHTVAVLLRRPTEEPRPSSRLAHRTIREGEAGTTVSVSVDGAGDAEHVVLAVDAEPWTAFRPSSGVVGVAAVPTRPILDIDLPVASLRWGRRPVGGGVVVATGPWAGREWGPRTLLPVMLTTLPTPGVYDGRAPVPHPLGLVGTHPARRAGDGTELASIRPFAPGDRLRRVHWPVSLRTGALHVTSTVAEEDSGILLLVDAGVEVGVSGGTTGAESSMDVAVRAAGALAEHYLHRGDRVGLRILGAASRGVVPLSSGRRHLRRVLETLSMVVPGARHDSDPRRFRVPPGTVVVVLSPMLSDQVVAATRTLAQRGLDLVVVDTMPVDLDAFAEGPRDRIAWRMRLLEREVLIVRVRRAGVPVARWSGPGTLDEVLRDLGRRARQPRMAHR